MGGGLWCWGVSCMGMVVEVGECLPESGEVFILMRFGDVRRCREGRWLAGCYAVSAAMLCCVIMWCRALTAAMLCCVCCDAVLCDHVVQGSDFCAAVLWGLRCCPVCSCGAVL